MGNKQRVRGSKEKDGDNQNDGATGKRATERDGEFTGKQQQSRGEVLCGGDQPGGERR